MEQGHSLLQVSADIAAVRAQGQTVRLALRNTERFGVVHLYFEHGYLVQVQGHKENPEKSFADFATWNQGSVRQDDHTASREHTAPNATLEQALNEALRELERRGVVQAIPMPAPPVAAPYQRQSPPRTPPPDHTPIPYANFREQGNWQQPYQQDVSDVPYVPNVPNVPNVHNVPTAPYVLNMPYPPYAETAGPTGPVPAPVFSPDGNMFDHQPPAHELFSTMQTIPIATANPAEYLADSQWQLLALVVRQVVEQAGIVIGKETADGFIRQSLAYGAVKRPPLRLLEMDSSGWLSPMPGQRLSAYPLADIADAVAILLTSFENRCGTLIGNDEAHRIVAAAAQPFSASLAQLGLAIAF